MRIGAREKWLFSCNKMVESLILNCWYEVKIRSCLLWLCQKNFFAKVKFLNYVYTRLVQFRNNIFNRFYNDSISISHLRLTDIIEKINCVEENPRAWILSEHPTWLGLQMLEALDPGQLLFSNIIAVLLFTWSFVLTFR